MKLFTRIATVSHPDVNKAYQYYVVGAKYHPSNSTHGYDSKYGFWSNDIEYDSNDPSKIKLHGSLQALDFYKENDNNIVMTHDFIDQDKQNAQSIENLDQYWKQLENGTIAMDVYVAVANIVSESFARNSIGEVCVSVKGASFDSLFRRTELFTLMENNNVSHFINISRENPKGSKYEKKEAFHVLHNEWLDLRIKNYDLSIKQGDTGEIHETAKNNLAKEIALSQQRLEERCFVPSVYCVKTPNASINQYSANDIQKERMRLEKVQDLLMEDPDLAQEVKKIKRGGLAPIEAQIITNAFHKSPDHSPARATEEIINQNIASNKIKRFIQTIEAKKTSRGKSGR